MTKNTVEIKTEGRRHYLIGNTYPIKNAIKSAGCNWDKDRGAWWTGKLEVAQQLVSGLASGAVVPASRWVKLATGFGILVPAGSTATPGSTVLVQSREGGEREVELAALIETKPDGSRIFSVPPKKRAVSAARPKMIGETSDLCVQFEGSKQNRKSNREIGVSCWIKDRGQRIACVVIGIQEAAWHDGDVLEDMGNYDHGGRGAYLGMDYFRRATLAEYEALQARDPRADGVAPSA